MAKKLVINCATCDARNAREEDYAHYESITINCATVLTNDTGKAVLKLLQDTCRDTGMTVVIITHNKALCAMADQVIRVRSGRVVSSEWNSEVTPVEKIEW